MSVFTNPADAAPSAAEAYVAAVLDMLGERDPWSVLAATPARLRDIVDDTPAPALREPEGPGRWSAGDVFAHLADSELVWAVRLRMVLGQDRPRLEGYDQDAWAARLGYDEIDPRRSVERFETARRWNLAILEAADDADLDRVGLHGERGEESLRHMVRLYAGHDLVHLAQARRILESRGSRIGTEAAGRKAGGGRRGGAV